MAPPCASCSLALGFDGYGVPPEGVELAFGKRLLVELATLCRWRDGIENAGVSDAGFRVVGDELVAVSGDPRAGVTRPRLVHTTSP